jgi:hypothetical protein
VWFVAEVLAAEVVLPRLLADLGEGNFPPNVLLL